MSLQALAAVPHFNNPIEETGDGSTYTINWLVKFTGTEDATAIERATMGVLALRASGIPQYNSQYPLNVAAYCTKRTARALQEKNMPTAQIVTTTFTTKAQDNQNEEEDPLAKKPDVSWSSIFERVVVSNAWEIKVVQGRNPIQTIDGALAPNPQKNFQNINQFDLGITNSAGDPFNPQPEADVPYMTCTIVQNLPFFNPQEAIALIGSINKSPFTVDGVKIGREQAVLLDRTAQIRYTGEISYREVTTTLLFKNTHALILQDRGFKVKVEEGARFAEIEDPKKDLTTAKQDGNATPEEVLLDGKGNQNDKKKKPVYLHFSYLKLTDFRKLNLPAARL